MNKVLVLAISAASLLATSAFASETTSTAPANETTKVESTADAHKAKKEHKAEHKAKKEHKAEHKDAKEAAPAAH